MPELPCGGPLSQRRTCTFGGATAFRAPDLLRANRRFAQALPDDLARWFSSLRMSFFTPIPRLLRESQRPLPRPERQPTDYLRGPEVKNSPALRLARTFRIGSRRPGKMQRVRLPMSLSVEELHEQGVSREEVVPNPVRLLNSAPRALGYISCRRNGPNALPSFGRRIAKCVACSSPSLGPA